MERLNYYLLQELAREFTVALCGPNGCQDYVNIPSTAVSSFPAKPVPLFLAGNAWSAIRMAQRLKPKLVIAGSGLTAPIARLISLLSQTSALVYLHGLDLVVNSRIYQALFPPLIRRCTGFIVNSKNTGNLLVNKGVVPDRIHLLHPGTILPSQTRGQSSYAFREQISAGDRPLLLSVGRLSARKGLIEFVHRSLPSLVAARPDLLLVIIGSAADQSLDSRNRGIRTRLIHQIKDLGLERNVLLLGHVDDSTLSQAYTASQLLIFPVLDLPGDIEGFGMVAVEAAAHGLPTVSFAVGGVTDAVAQGKSGYLINPGDYSTFSSVILNELSEPKVSAASCRQFAEQFSWERFGERLRAICRRYIATC